MDEQEFERKTPDDYEVGYRKPPKHRRFQKGVSGNPTYPNALAPSRAAHYVRMSTEHQQYSPENQMDIIRQYANDHNMEIVQVYSDHGRSGLNIAGREGLNRLMADVEAKRIDFTSLLVYDVSRWGRFQDVDESAYYEYVLKRAGVRVHYCAEQFENDGSMSSSVLKTLKRSMAAEYSRELSVKVFSGQCRLIELGFRQGGPAGYGLRRQLIDRDQTPKGLLGRGDTNRPGVMSYIAHFVILITAFGSKCPLN